MRSPTSSVPSRAGAVVLSALVVGACAFDGAGIATSEDSRTPPRRDVGARDAADSSRPDLWPDFPSLVDVPIISLDRGVDPDGGFTCPSECNGGCSGGVCNISCVGGGTCSCPPGLPCRVLAQNGNRGVDCSLASSCEIVCGQQGCFGNVRCGSGPCSVRCEYNSCRGEILCQSAKKCDVHCTSYSCMKAIRCGTGPCVIRCDKHACSGSLRCGAGPCQMTCADQACMGKLDCGSSCGCRAQCGFLSCFGGVTCPSKCKSKCGFNDGCDCP